MSKEAFVLLGSKVNYKVIVISELTVTWPRTEASLLLTAISSDCNMRRVICLNTTRAG